MKCIHLPIPTKYGGFFLIFNTHLFPSLLCSRYHITSFLIQFLFSSLGHNDCVFIKMIKTYMKVWICQVGKKYEFILVLSSFNFFLLLFKFLILSSLDLLSFGYPKSSEIRSHYVCSRFSSDPNNNSKTVAADHP